MLTISHEDELFIMFVLGVTITTCCAAFAYLYSIVNNWVKHVNARLKIGSLTGVGGTEHYVFVDAMRKVVERIPRGNCEAVDVDFWLKAYYNQDCTREDLRQVLMEHFPSAMFTSDVNPTCIRVTKR